MRPFILALLLAGTVAVRGQSGVSLSYTYLNVHGDVNTEGLLLGFHFDHDIEPHLAYGLDACFGPGSVGKSHTDEFGDRTVLDFGYRSYYIVGDNEATSVYIGSHLGLRHVKTEGSNSERYTAVPVGLRVGIRGGLEGGFADLFFEAGVQLGGSFKDYYGHTYGTGGVQYMIGLSYGFGWD